MIGATANVRPLNEADLVAVAAIHSTSFPRQHLSVEWIAANARAYPRARYYVSEVEGNIVGYVLWSEKSGFRSPAVVELEQIAVAPQHRRKGVAQDLITRSLAHVQQLVGARGSTIAKVVVTTRADNAARRLYERSLGASVEATIRGLFSADEVIMVASDPLCGNPSLERP